MTSEAPPFLVVGQLSKAHGNRGEIFVWPLTDHPESTFAPGVVLRLADESGNLPDPFMGPVTIETVRPFKQGWLVLLAGVETRTEAERITGRYLLRPFEEAPDLAEGEVFFHQLLGMTVVTAAGDAVGKVVEVYDIQPVHMLEVEAGDGRRHLVPFSQQVVRRVDTENMRLTVELPDGLLDL